MNVADLPDRFSRVVIFGASGSAILSNDDRDYGLRLLNGKFVIFDFSAFQTRSGEMVKRAASFLYLQNVSRDDTLQRLQRQVGLAVLEGPFLELLDRTSPDSKRIAAIFQIGRDWSNAAFAYSRAHILSGFVPNNFDERSLEDTIDLCEQYGFPRITSILHELGRALRFIDASMREFRKIFGQEVLPGAMQCLISHGVVAEGALGLAGRNFISLHNLTPGLLTDGDLINVHNQLPSFMDRLMTSLVARSMVFGAAQASDVFSDPSRPSTAQGLPEPTVSRPPMLQ